MSQKNPDLCSIPTAEMAGATNCSTKALASRVPSRDLITSVASTTCPSSGLPTASPPDRGIMHVNIQLTGSAC